jgi:hypothetical protein
MIKYIKHAGIDKLRWDECIRTSVNRRVYAFSWYLDLVSPGWEALVEDDYTHVFPLTQHRKWTIAYLAQPFFAQQLGIFSHLGISERKVDEFVRAIPGSFRFVEIQLNSMNTYHGETGQTTLRLNHELDLAPGYTAILGHYSQNTRRNLKKAAEAELIIAHNVEVDQLITLFESNYGTREGKLRPLHYGILRNLLRYCIEQGKGYILGSKTIEGDLHAGAFFLFDDTRVYFLFAASANEARQNGAMFFLIDSFIREKAGSKLLLDFEGGNEPSLGRFYKSFGAACMPYPALKINRFPKGAEKGLNFIRKLRS